MESANNHLKKEALPNIILLTIDALRYETFVENIDNLRNLKMLKSRSACFENAFSVGPATRFSFPGIISSVYPFNFGTGIGKKITGIDTILKQAGYKTAQINECNVLLTPYFGYGRDIDYQKHILNLSDTEKHHEIENKLLVGDGKAKGDIMSSYPLKKTIALLRFIWLRSILIKKFGKYCISFIRFAQLYCNKKVISFQRTSLLHKQFQEAIQEFIAGTFESPQFLWIHTIINHLPYLPSEKSVDFNERYIDYLNCRGISQFMNQKTGRKLKGLYIKSLVVTDELVGDIIDLLAAKKLLDGSIIIVTSDHGEEFMEDGYFGHDAESSSDRLLHVPLMFYSPKFIPPSSIDAPVSTIDILPTISDLLAIKTPQTSRGVSLKELIFSMANIKQTYHDFWKRPLFSEGWTTDGMLDRSPGHESKKRIFTVRKGVHKLKVTREYLGKGGLLEGIELWNWVSNERLDTKYNGRLIEELKYELDKHLYNERLFAQRMKKNSERQLIRSVVKKMYPKERA